MTYNPTGKGLHGKALWDWAMSLPLTPRPARQVVSFAPDRSQSPLESKMLDALSRHRQVLGTIYQQHAIKTDVYMYHVDFATVRGVGTRLVQVAVEVDGFAFHDGDRVRASKDKSRDRALLRVGWLPMRFTGREVHQDARRCALEVCGVVIEWISRIKEGCP